MKRKRNAPPKAPFLLEALEDTIGTLEMDMFEAHVMNLAYQNVGNVEDAFPASFIRSTANFGTVRMALLDSLTRSFDWVKYVGGTDLGDFAYDNYSYGSVRRRFTLAAIASWMMSSRRVLQLTPELQTLLSLTSLKNTDWSMLEWPFDSFVVNLAEPMTYGRGEWQTTCDAILIGRESKIPGATIVYAGSTEVNRADCEYPFSIYFLRKGLKTISECYPIAEQQRLLRMATNNPEQAFETIRSRKNRKWNECRGWSSHYVSSEIFGENGIQDFVYGGPFSDGFEDDEHTAGLQNVLEVLFGTMLYMSSLQHSKRASAENSGQWAPLQNQGTSTFCRQIADASLVAHVGSEIKMAPDELRRFRDHLNLSKGEREVSAHFRTGFFRRPKGQGQNPEALKSEWVRPCIVRRDRLAEGALPVGAIQVLK